MAVIHFVQPGAIVVHPEVVQTGTLNNYRPPKTSLYSSYVKFTIKTAFVPEMIMNLVHEFVFGSSH